MVIGGEKKRREDTRRGEREWRRMKGGKGRVLMLFYRSTRSDQSTGGVQPFIEVVMGWCDGSSVDPQACYFFSFSFLFF